MSLKFENGLRYGWNAENKRICVGAQMGRPDDLPEDRDIPIKVRLEKMRLVDSGKCYDSGGAYWGAGSARTGWMYCGYNKTEGVRIFIRATTRTKAKEHIRSLLPQATFYR